ncbi:MAG: hypothetical protein EP348_11805 [Alphaproteobacteria bacterium]|nr:MAG: hypothetical protein EP348_11805 [Alphaproteobacteria bacterium]
MILAIRLLPLFALALLPAIPAFAEEARLEVSQEDCANIMKYVEEPGVEYKPGVDVDGNPVAPADLDGGSQIKLPDHITIDLSLPLKDLIKHVDPKLKNADVYIGAVEYDIASNRLYFNGQELADPAANAIAVECRKRFQ